MFEGNATKCDGRLAVRVVRIDGEDFGFRLVDGQEEELSSAFESEDEALETFSGVTNDSHIVCVEKDLEEKVDLIGADGSDTELAINGVAKGYTIGGVGECNTDDVVEEDGKEGRC